MVNYFFTVLRSFAPLPNYLSYLFWDKTGYEILLESIQKRLERAIQKHQFEDLDLRNFEQLEFLSGTFYENLNKLQLFHVDKWQDDYHSESLRANRLKAAVDYELEYLNPTVHGKRFKHKTQDIFWTVIRLIPIPIAILSFLSGKENFKQVVKEQRLNGLAIKDILWMFTKVYSARRMMLTAYVLFNFICLWINIVNYDKIRYNCHVKLGNPVQIFFRPEHYNPLIMTQEEICLRLLEESYLETDSEKIKLLHRKIKSHQNELDDLINLRDRLIVCPIELDMWNSND